MATIRCKWCKYWDIDDGNSDHHHCLNPENNIDISWEQGLCDFGETSKPMTEEEYGENVGRLIEDWEVE